MNACAGCGDEIPKHLIACSPCWRRVPNKLQRRLTAAWRDIGHWLKAHPKDRG